MARNASQLAQEAKNFVTTCRNGVLSTISVSQGGYPFGSITPYDITFSGEIIIYISFIAEHYKNLEASPRASICVFDQFGLHDAQAHARATVLCDFNAVPEIEVQAVRASYERRFPGSINHEIAHNFLFMRGTPVKVRWIGGFGDIAWIQAQKFTEVAPDPLAYPAMEIITHMNQDHTDALGDLLRKHHAKPDPPKNPQMTGISSESMTIAYDDREGKREVKIPFGVSVKSADEVRNVIIGLLKQART